LLHFKVLPDRMAAKRRGKTSSYFSTAPYWQKQAQEIASAKCG